LGWLVKRTHDEKGFGEGFGFGRRSSLGTFGHADIDSVMGFADPVTGIALAFLTTDGLANHRARIRNRLTDLILEAIG
jgi:CubicO group peptidase (beta-lactamase class C family)